MKFRLVVFLLIVNLIALYAGHFDNAFHFDDSHTVESNSYITSLKHAGRFFTDPGTFSTVPTNQSYRPLLPFTYAIDYQLGKYFFGNGLNPFFFHLTSFTAFLIQLALMYLLFIRLLSSYYDQEKSRYLSLTAVAWYGFHGAIPDTVNYISSRSDVFSTLGVVASVLMFTYRPLRKSFLYLIPAVFAMLSKEQAAVLPGLIFFYVLLFDSPIAKSARCEAGAPEKITKFSFVQLFSDSIKALLASLPSLILCAAIFILGTKLSSTWKPGGTSRLMYLVTQPYVVLDYFRMFFIPTGMSGDTDWELIRNISDIRLWIGLSFVALCLLAITKTAYSPRFKFVSFGLIWFFLALVPSSSIIPLAEVKNDHRLFFPFVGLSLGSTVFFYRALNYGFERLQIKRKQLVTLGLVSAVLLCNMAVAVERIGVWNTEASLWKDVTQVSPKNGRGLMNYALTMMQKGQYDEAEKYFLKALVLTPNYSTLHINLGILYNATGRLEQAKKHFEYSIRLEPNDPTVLYFYGEFLASHDKCSEAISFLEKSVVIAPGRKAGYDLLISCHAKLKNESEEAVWRSKLEKLL